MFRALIAVLLAAPLIGAIGGASATHRDEDAAVRAVLDSYLAAVTCPDPKPLDVEILAADIEAFWSTGDRYLGRDAFAEAVAEGVADIVANFESFSAVAKDVTIRRKGDLAWLTCRVDVGGKLTRDRGATSHSVRSTFVFERRNDRWVMVHEHSSRPPTRK
ncbi:MAG: nuclear transport factor 2 family protein [bacterium]|nr:nuclear transport factor 2 family protein [bacterium]